MKNILCLIVAGFSCLTVSAIADIVLLGNNDPWRNVNDGDFDLVPGWQLHQSPHWTVNEDLSKGNGTPGIAKGVFNSGGKTCTVVDSKVLDTIFEYQTPVAGDVLKWRFVAKSQHKTDAKASLSLVFGDRVRVVIEKVTLPGGPGKPGVFEGTYTITAEDAVGGMPFVRMSLYAEGIAIFLQNVDLSVINAKTAGPEKLDVKVSPQGIELNWSTGENDESYNVYRKPASNRSFKKVAGNLKMRQFTDTAIINGLEYTYLVTTMLTERESSASPMVTVRRLDSVPPKAPASLKAIGLDTMVELNWKAEVNDIESFSVFRGSADGKNMREIAHGVTKPKFIDDLPAKSALNSYAVQAVDYSSNKSQLSEIAKAKVKAVHGASFSDLILPMPIHKQLRSDLWGADGVVPRDPDNGIEHPDWSYWGGRPVKDKDDKYHMLVVRWPEGGPKGHYEWTRSTTVHSVSDRPTGPYVPTGDIAYDYANGLGHNADITILNDGRYLLYSLIHWKPMLFTSDSMAGPWKLEGEMLVDYDAKKLGDEREYQVQRNLSGLQLADGSMLWVTKFGRMIISKDSLLGPYKVLTDVVQKNETIPQRYRKSNYEDPVMWRDEVQFHQIINAFLDYRAIYLRSPDGINWKYDTGVAYTPDSTFYEDGTHTHWYKLERPHVLQDEFGRATHLSLAAIDTVKRQDFANDKHSSKNLIIPLTIHKRLTILNIEPINKNTKQIRILVHSEEGFDAQKDLDLESLRCGAPEEVNFGLGCKVISSKKHVDGLILVFDGKNNGITEKNFACKLIGKTKNGELVVGFSKLSGQD